jgi:hypothetical protein
MQLSAMAGGKVGMKIKIVVPFLVCSAFVTLGALLFTGCAHLDRLYNKEVQELASDPIGTNTTFRTNFVVMEEASTNEDGVITPAKMAAVVTPEVTVQYAPPTYVTNLVPRASIETGIQATGGLPVPWAGTVALGLGWLYSAYASLRNKQVAKAVVQSVQVGREFLQSTPEGVKIDAELKRLLARHQQYAGVAAEVRKLLDKYVPDH